MNRPPLPHSPPSSNTTDSYETVLYVVKAPRKGGIQPQLHQCYVRARGVCNRSIVPSRRDRTHPLRPYRATAPKAPPQAITKTGMGLRVKNNPARTPDLNGRCWTRTSDPIDVSDVLCQLS